VFELQRSFIACPALSRVFIARIEMAMRSLFVRIELTNGMYMNVYKRGGAIWADFRKMHQ